MSKMTHIHNKNKNNCFQILLQTVLSVKQIKENVLNFSGIFAKPCIKLQTEQEFVVDGLVTLVLCLHLFLTKYSK